mgnify:FL=1
MAKKGQKFMKHTPELKAMILKEYQDGEGTPRSLGQKYNLSPKTIETWIYKNSKGIDITVDHRPKNSGKKKTKNLTLQDYKERYEILKKYQAFLEARREKK